MKVKIANNGVITNMVILLEINDKVYQVNLEEAEKELSLRTLVAVTDNKLSLIKTSLKIGDKNVK